MSVCFELQQESENALAIKIREQVLDKIAACKTEEELKRTIVKILQENDDQIDIEKIQDSNEISRITDNFIACSLESNPDNLNQTQIQIGELLRNAIDLICNPPTFDIPYPFPTIDISGEFLKQLLLALLRLAIKIILSIIKKLLALLVDICTTGLSALNGFGSKEFKELLASSVTDAIDNSFVGEVFSAFGLNTDGTAATAIVVGEEESCEEYNAAISADEVRTTVSNIKSVSKFLDDLSFMATPVELCSLLNNKANEQTYAMVEELLEFEYPEMRKRLNNRTKISSLFSALGSKSDPSICQIIENNADAIISQPELCFTGDTNKLRENLLKTRNLRDDQIKDIIAKERDRNKQNLEKIAELASIIKTNPNKIFGEQSPIFCKGSTPGIVTLDSMPSLKQNISDVIDQTFNIFAMVFRKNTSTFIDSIITNKALSTTEIIPKFINYMAYDSNNEPILIEDGLNQEFMKLTSNGKYELCDDRGRTDQDSLLSYYDFDVNSQPVINKDVIDVQTLISVTNFDAFDENVYIKKYNYVQTVLEDLDSGISYVQDSSKIETDITDLSITLNVPEKYKDEIFKIGIADFSSIPSTEKIQILTIGENNE